MHSTPRPVGGVPVGVFSDCVYNKFFWLYFFLLVSWVWCDWPLNWFTNHCSLVLWCCLLGHMIRNIVCKWWITPKLVGVQVSASFNIFACCHLHWRICPRVVCIVSENRAQCVRLPSTRSTESAVQSATVIGSWTDPVLAVHCWPAVTCTMTSTSSTCVCWWHANLQVLSSVYGWRASAAPVWLHQRHGTVDDV